MKIKLSVLLLAGTLCGSAQNLVITYDAFNQTYTYNGGASRPKFLRDGQTVSFHVVNLNRFVVDVGFNKTTNTFNATPPSVPSVGSIAAIMVGGGGAAKLHTTASLDIAFRDVKADIDLANQFVISLEDWRVDAADIGTIIAGAGRLNFNTFMTHLDALDQEYITFLSSAVPTDLPDKEIIAMKKAIDDQNLRTKYVELFKTIDHLGNGQPFQYISPAVTAEDDEIVLEVTLDPKATKKNLPISAEKLEQKFPVLRRFRYSFSTGLFVSNLVNARYQNRPNLVTDSSINADTISSYTLIKDKSPSTTLGAAAFFHFTYQPIYGFGAGLCMGAGADIEEKTQYLAGLTLAFGHKQRFLINAGMVWSQVEGLSNGFTEGSVTAKPLEFKTVKTLERGGFFSLSYNLAK